MKQGFSAPSHLSQRSQDIWAALVPARRRSIGALTLLSEALTALDRATQAAAEVAKAPLTTRTVTTNAIHANPLLKIERESRRRFWALWADLSLGYDPSIDGGSLERWLAQQAGAQQP